MMIFTSEFECGNGKNFRQLAADRFRMEVVGDKPTYCYYFCFDAHNDGPAAEIAIEVWHDPAINDVPGFMSHFPCTIWTCAGRPDLYCPLDQARCETHADHLVIRLALEANQSLRVTDLWPSPYSETCAFLQTLARERADRCELFSIGKSIQGREILGLRAGPADAPRVLCIAGQHPIEFSGTWGMRAIADYVSSLLPDAAAFRKKFQVEVIPAVNPDGSVAGRNGFNAENFDMYQAFGEKPDAGEPEAHESRLLWRWATSRPPALWLNIHNYLGWRTSSEPPFDGWYTLDSDLFSDPERRRLYQALCDTLRLETDGPSTYIKASTHGANTLCHQMAKRFGIPHVFYEINGSTGGAFLSGKRALRVFRRAVNTLTCFLYK